ncbi:MAG: nuclear transport factor 2 family protein [Ilumatobacteraceae bacterium]
MNYYTKHHIAALYSTPGAFDPSAIASALEPDVTLHVPGSHPLSGDHHGVAGVGQFLERTRNTTDDGEHIELIEILDGETHIGAYVRVTAHRGGRTPLVNHTIHLFRLTEDDRIAEIWFHNREQAAVDEFWS